MADSTFSTFDTQYKKLNPEQRQAVDIIDGPVIVIAGPGTGKTSILTLRISNILRQTDTAPESILALTFTESGVHSIRKKLVEIIGATGYRVAIHTFHSFCNDIIKNYPQEFPRIIGAQHVTDVDQINLLEEIITKTKLAVLKPHGNPVYYLKPILSFIKELKREDVGPKEYAKYIDHFSKELEGLEDFKHEKGVYKGEIKAKYKPAIRKVENSRELALVYEKYEKALAEHRLYDYEDMIIEVLRELRENKDLLLELQENYQYILADEHQDANRGQNRLLELLSGFHADPNLFVVGDEKQAIFRFQGASLENFLYFKKRFPKAKVISLNKNYRSTQGILDASHSLIEKNSSGGLPRVKLESREKSFKKGSDKRKSDKVDISVHECESSQAEAGFLVRDILAKIKNGVKPEEVAVLFRDNRDGDDIARTFDMQGVPYALHSDIDVIADEQIAKLFYILRAVNNFGDDILMTPVLFIDFLGLNHLDAFKVIRYGHDKRRGLADVMRSKAELQNAGVEDVAKLTDLYKLLHELSVTAKNKGLVEALQEVVAKTGFVGFILSKPRSLELISAYDALLAHAVEFLERRKEAKLSDYLGLLQKMAEHGVSVKARSVTSYPGKVNLMTAHKSKGLEFEYIYGVHLNEGHWGGRRNATYFLPIGATAETGTEDSMSDERRLLYVVLTRAKKEAILSYATHKAGKEILPSRFLEEIDKGLVSFKIEKTEASVNLPNLPKQTNGTIHVKNREYLEKLFLEQGFSVSALNNYLTCPWRYFFLNLLRVPQVEERHQLFGTAIHETLKIFFDGYKNDRPLSRAEFLKQFENSLNRKALSDSDYELFLERGRKALGGYFDEYKGTWPKNIFNEYSISGIHLPVKLEDGRNINVILRGQLDKVEFLDGSEVNVVDYKTGNPKSRREIEGETQNSEGNYKRQLIFYKILIDHFGKAGFSMQTGEIDFVEPNKQGKYKKEKFEVTQVETEELIKEIERVSREIIGLSFWTNKCKEPECQFCELKKLIGL